MHDIELHGINEIITSPRADVVGIQTLLLTRGNLKALLTGRTSTTPRFDHVSD